jgi:hypothetical protein
MFTSITTFLNKAPTLFWAILAGSIGVSFVILAVGIASVLYQATDIKYKRGDIEVSFGEKAKELANNSEYASKELDKKLLGIQHDISNLKGIVNSNNSDPELIKRFVDDVDKSFQILKPTAEAASKNTEELKNLVEKAIEQPE